MTIRIIILCLGIYQVQAQHHQKREYVFGTYRYADNDRVTNIEPFALFFAKSAGVSAKVVSYPSVHELLDALQKGEVDFVFINTFGYILMKERTDAYAIAAALHVNEEKRSTYQSVIVSNAATGLSSLEDLKTKDSLSLALVNPGSTSGNLVPRLKLATLGLDPESFFREVTYVKNHALTLRLVSEGKFDLGAFGNEEYYKALENDPSLKAKVNVLWESNPIPLGPALFKKDLPSSIRKRFIKSLLRLHGSNKAALEAIKARWTEAKHADYFQRVDDAYYSQLWRTGNAAALDIIKRFSN